MPRRGPRDPRFKMAGPPARYLPRTPPSKYHIDPKGQVWIRCGYCGALELLSHARKIRIGTFILIKKEHYDWTTESIETDYHRVARVHVVEGCGSCATLLDSLPMTPGRDGVDRLPFLRYKEHRDA